ncbi:MAG: hypothetical protein FWD44_01225 [Oscillospiraceae bacterium]|nr:hypothetical protein [Oscillospiraceae bacterium]
MSIPIKGISIPIVNRTMIIGEAQTLKVAFYPCDTTQRGVIWTIKYGSECARVEDGDKVRAITSGIAILRATSSHKCSISAECVVTIRATERTG